MLEVEVKRRSVPGSGGRRGDHHGSGEPDAADPVRGERVCRAGGRQQRASEGNRDHL